MESPHVFQIALPFQFFVACPEMESGKILDRTGRPVVSGNPFGIDNGDSTGRNRNCYGCMQDVAWSVRSINAEAFCNARLRDRYKAPKKKNHCQCAPKPDHPLLL